MMATQANPTTRRDGRTAVSMPERGGQLLPDAVKTILLSIYV
jgi:hypothetical protein